MTSPRAPVREPQSASRVLMVRPARFDANPETAGTNAFQRTRAGLSAAEAQARALAEFDELARRLAASGVEVVLADDTPEPHTPDAVFPNNWVSFHADGTAVLYPLHAPSRRREVRPELLELAGAGRALLRVVDLRALGEQGAFLEGTGSLVLDRPGRVAYACLSPRTSPAALAAFAQALDYEVESFHALGPDGAPVYHTNVMLSLGRDFALVCLAAVPDPAERARLRARLASGGRELVELAPEQMAAFAGNALELSSAGGDALLVLSTRALASLDQEQVRRLERHARIVHAPLDTLEDLGGGSARCMLAEVHLPPA